MADLNSWSSCLYTYALPGLAGLSFFAALLHLRSRNSRNNFLKMAPTLSAKGKTILITGASSGIGKAAALEFAKRDGRVIMACRDRKRTENTIYDIRKQTNKGHLVIELVDLASLTSVKNFADRILKKESVIDVLVNNAGLFNVGYSETEDKIETTFGVNFASHFALTLLLLPLLKTSTSSRIINVSSTTYKNAEINFDDVNLTTTYKPMKAYAQSKLANILFSNHLKNLLKNTNITVTAVSPGFVNSNLFRDYTEKSMLYRTLKATVGSMFLKSTKDGSKTIVFAALDPVVEGSDVLFYRNCAETKLLPVALDDNAARKVWELGESITGVKAAKYL